MLSSAKLHISESRLIRQTSLMKMLKSRGLVHRSLWNPKVFLPFDSGYLDNYTVNLKYLCLIHILLVAANPYAFV